ncbi:unnamed protein product [Phaeothamnion confervicola]
MQVLNHLLKDGKLDEEAASVLLALARKRDEELMRAFDGALEGDAYDGAKFDAGFFLIQAKGIAQEKAEEREKAIKEEAAEAVAAQAPAAGKEG